ncbi:MAG TPA: DUF424 family protein [Nanoarchaeota archaeon]|nr:DUF424 family protein [Nanoarchaeota archaeon]
MGKILIKIHESGVVSLCDANLLGKSFEEGDFCLDVSEHFFKGEERTEEYIAGMLQSAGNAAIVGKDSVDLAVKHGIISKDCVRKVGKVPFAYLFAV